MLNKNYGYIIQNLTDINNEIDSNRTSLPELWWKMDDAPGSTTAKNYGLLGSAGDLSISEGNPTFVNGPVSGKRSVLLTGHFDTLSGALDTFTYSENISVSTWVKFIDYLYYYNVFLTKLYDSSHAGVSFSYNGYSVDENGAVINSNPAFQMYFYFQDKSTNIKFPKIINFPVSFVDLFSSNHHLAMTYDGNFMKGYHNGALVGTLSIPNCAIITSNTEHNYGIYGDSGGQWKIAPNYPRFGDLGFKGNVWDVRVTNKVRSGEEILNEFNTSGSDENKSFQKVTKIPSMIFLQNPLKINVLQPSIFPPPENVVVLLHGTGAVGDTQFLDNSYNPAIFTAINNITTQLNPNIPPVDPNNDFNQFNTSSIYTPQAGYLNAPSSSNYVLGTGSFTLEAFIYPKTYGSGFGIWFDTRANGYGSALFVGFAPGGAVRVLVGNLFTFMFDGVASVPLNKWSHIAIVRYDTVDPITDTNCAIYLNGNLDRQFKSLANLNEGNMHVGQDIEGNNAYAFNGYLNEVRLTKGIAVYSGSSFTVANAPFPNANP